MKGKKQYLSILMVLAFVVALPASGVWGQEGGAHEPAGAAGPEAPAAPENPYIWYEDVEIQKSTPTYFFRDTYSGAADWWLRAYHGGTYPDWFEIYDWSNGRRPFAIETGAPTWSLHMENTGEVGLMTSNPSAQLHVLRAGAGTTIYGDSNATTTYGAGVLGQTESTSGRGVYGHANAATGVNYGVYGYTASSSGRGVIGNAGNSGGTTYGVYGQVSSNNGRAVYGTATAATGGTHGVWGRTASTSGSGVRGEATATSGLTYGVVGTNASSAGAGVAGSGVFGVWGLASSPIGTGVFGWNANSSGAGYGVQGVSYSSAGKGVYGGTTHATGTTYAVFGVANSTLGRGVYGNATATTGITYGVAGVNASSSGRGVFGYANNANGLTYGVAGRSDSPGGRGLSGYNAALTGNSAGIYGDVRSPNGWAGKFITPYGNGVYISTPAGKTGLTVASGTKNAVVPTADGSRLLYSEESTEVWFTDYGFGQLQKGVAVVPIDPVFAQTVNLQQPYHVFLEEYGPDELYVSQRTPEYFEVRANKGKPNVEFSYRLVGKRLGHEGQRLASATWADDDPNLYPEKRADWEAMYALPEDMLEPLPPVELLEEPPVLEPPVEPPPEPFEEHLPTDSELE